MPNIVIKIAYRNLPVNQSKHNKQTVQKGENVHKNHEKKKALKNFRYLIIIEENENY